MAETPKVSRVRVIDVRCRASYCMFAARSTPFPSHDFHAPAAYLVECVNAGGTTPADTSGAVRASPKET